LFSHYEQFESNVLYEMSGATSNVVGTLRATSGNLVAATKPHPLILIFFMIVRDRRYVDARFDRGVLHV